MCRGEIKIAVQRIDAVTIRPRSDRRRLIYNGAGAAFNHIDANRTGNTNRAASTGDDNTVYLGIVCCLYTHTVIRENRRPAANARLGHIAGRDHPGRTLHTYKPAINRYRNLNQIRTRFGVN